MKNAMFEGAITAAMLTVFKSFTSAAEEKGADFLKSKVFGFGLTDETLYWDARAIAIKEGMVTAEEANKLDKKMNSFDDAAKARIIRIIGSGEQEVMTEDIVIKDGSPVFDKKGNPLKKKITYKGNMRGSVIVAMLCKMDDEQLSEFISAARGLDTFQKSIKDSLSKVFKALEESQIRQDGDKVFPNETWLERKAREIKNRGSI